MKRHEREQQRREELREELTDADTDPNVRFGRVPESIEKLEEIKRRRDERQEKIGGTLQDLSPRRHAVLWIVQWLDDATRPNVAEAIDADEVTRGSLAAEDAEYTTQKARTDLEYLADTPLVDKRKEGDNQAITYHVSWDLREYDRRDRDDDAATIGLEDAETLINTPPLALEELSRSAVRQQSMEREIDDLMETVSELTETVEEYQEDVTDLAELLDTTLKYTLSIHRRIDEMMLPERVLEKTKTEQRELRRRQERVMNATYHRNKALRRLNERGKTDLKAIEIIMRIEEVESKVNSMNKKIPNDARQFFDEDGEKSDEEDPWGWDK